MLFEWAFQLGQGLESYLFFRCWNDHLKVGYRRKSKARGGERLVVGVVKEKQGR